MSVARQLEIKNHILNNAKALGNTNRSLKHVCSELIDNALKRGDKLQAIADRTYLSVQTVERLQKMKESKNGLDYSPRLDTIERLLRSFDAEISLDQVKIARKYQNAPKL